MGFAVGSGLGVTRTVAVGAVTAVGVADAAAEEVEVYTRPGTASHATSAVASNATRTLILLG